MTYKRYTISCTQCKTEIDSSNFNKHYNSKICKGEELRYTRSLGYESRKLRSHCIFCNKECKTFQSLTSHEVVCKENPDRKVTTNNYEIVCRYCGVETKNKRHESLCESNPEKQTPKNQFIVGNENGVPYVFSQDSLDKNSKSNTGKKRTEITRDRLSKSMQLAVIKYPEAYSGGRNNNRVKVKTCSNGYKVQGGWEESFVEYCLINGIKISQVRESFSYTHKGKQHKYFPDFYLDNYDIFVEVKGYKTEVDDSKWNSLTTIHDKKLLIIDSRVIRNIKNNSMKIDDIINTYTLFGMTDGIRTHGGISSSAYEADTLDLLSYRHKSLRT